MGINGLSLLIFEKGLFDDGKPLPIQISEGGYVCDDRRTKISGIDEAVGRNIDIEA